MADFDPENEPLEELDPMSVGELKGECFDTLKALLETKAEALLTLQQIDGNIELIRQELNLLNFRWGNLRFQN